MIIYLHRAARKENYLQVRVVFNDVYAVIHIVIHQKAASGKDEVDD